MVVLEGGPFRMLTASITCPALGSLRTTSFRAFLMATRAVESAAEPGLRGRFNSGISRGRKDWIQYFDFGSVPKSVCLQSKANVYSQAREKRLNGANVKE